VAKKWYLDCEYAFVLIDFGGFQLQKNILIAKKKKKKTKFVISNNKL
jgi:hypothetical protein